MAVYRKPPQTFKQYSGSSRYMKSLLPFSGLEINENPLLATEGSCSDMLNMVVDDNSFLTLRPRIVADPEQVLANSVYQASKTGDYLLYSIDLDVVKLKDGYLFLTGKDGKPTIIEIEITMGRPDTEQNVGVEIQIPKTSTSGYFQVLFYLDDYTEMDEEAITDLLVSEINTSIANIISEWTLTRIGYATIRLTSKINKLLTNTAVSIDFDFQDESEADGTIEITQDGVSPVDNALCFVVNGTAHWIQNAAVAGIKSFDDYLIIPEKDYYRFLLKDTGVHYLLKPSGSTWTFEAAVPYVPTYKAALKDTASIKDAVVYEDLNILSSEYKLSVAYDSFSNVDLSVFKSQATRVSGEPYVYDEITDLNGRVIANYTANGYTYFLATDYTTVSTLSSGSASFNFYYYNFETDQSALAFVVKVYANGTYSDGISKENLAKLYSSTIQKDNNGSYIYKLHYDSISHSLIRAIRTSDYVLDIYQYTIADFEFTDTTYTSDIIPGASAPLWIWYYCNGKLGIYGRRLRSGGQPVAFLVYDTSTKVAHALIGDIINGVVGFEGGTISWYPISNYFVANGNEYLVTTCQLDSYLDSMEPFVDDMKHGCLYYDISVAIDPSSVVNLDEVASFVPERATWSRIAIAGDQVLVYSVRAGNYEILRVNLAVGVEAQTLNIGAILFANPDILGIESIMITEWGTPFLLVSTADDLSIVKIDFNGSVLAGYLKYYLQELNLGDDAYSLVWPGVEAFDIRSFDEDVLIRIRINDDILEYTYSLANNDVNPLKIDQKIIDSYTDMRAQYTFDSPVVGTALVKDSRLYYNETHTFITMQGNYDYIPVIHCRKATRPIRFASSYLQSLGIVYELNNVEYVGFLGNPYRTGAYLAHTEIPTYDAIEQRAIDYKKNGHLVTFAGLTVYLTDSGLYALNFNPETPQDTERRATLISHAVNPKLLKEDLDTVIMANHDPYILVMFPTTINTRVYALKILSNQWSYWELPIIVDKTEDDNIHLRLVDGDTRYIFTAEPVSLDTNAGIQTYTGNVEKYLDFDTDAIPWYWKSQVLHFGAINSRKQITESHFTFVNTNATFGFDRDTFDINQESITRQAFGIRYYSFKEFISEAPTVEYEGTLQIINNIRRRTYLNRFKYCQLICYNIIDEDNPIQDKVRIANIVLVYKPLTGGK